MSRVFAICILLSGALLGQADEKEDVWQPLKFLVGKWEGWGDGRWGVSTVEREYQFVLEDTFLQGINKSIYEPQEKNPKGEEHENWDFFGYDRSRKKFVLRQFHNEAIFEQFILESISDDGKTLVFVTEQIENFAPGWRAKETYRFFNENEFEELFELAAPNKDFELYVKNRFKRKE